MPSPPLGLGRCLWPLWGVFDWVISSDLLPLGDPGAPALLHHSSGSRSSPGISFAPSSLALAVPGGCYRTLVLTICQFFCLSLSLQSFAPVGLPFLQFLGGSLGWLCLLFWLLLSFGIGVLVSFSFLCCCSFCLSYFECSRVLHSFWPHRAPSWGLVVS